MMVYISTKFPKISLTVVKLQSGHDFYTKKKSKGHNSIKSVDEVTVLVTSSYSDLYLYQVS